MKTKLLLSLLALALSGCRSDLGDFKHIGKTPDLKVLILTYKVVPTDNKYSSPTFSYSGVVMENTPFPVKHYALSVGMLVKFGTEKEYTVSNYVDVKDGKGTIEGEIYLSDIAESALKSPVIFEVKVSNWSPISPAKIAIEVKQ